MKRKAYQPPFSADHTYDPAQIKIQPSDAPLLDLLKEGLEVYLNEPQVHRELTVPSSEQHLIVDVTHHLHQAAMCHFPHKKRIDRFYACSPATNSQGRQSTLFRLSHKSSVAIVWTLEHEPSAWPDPYLRPAHVRWDYFLHALRYVLQFLFEEQMRDDEAEEVFQRTINLPECREYFLEQVANTKYFATSSDCYWQAEYAMDWITPYSRHNIPFMQWLEVHFRPAPINPNGRWCDIGPRQRPTLRKKK